MFLMVWFFEWMQKGAWNRKLKEEQKPHLHVFWYTWHVRLKQNSKAESPFSDVLSFSSLCPKEYIQIL